MSNFFIKSDKQSSEKLEHLSEGTEGTLVTENSTVFELSEGKFYFLQR